LGSPGHAIQFSGGGRRRARTARTYLHPAMKRPNLQVVTKALARSILFDGKGATGVEFERGGVVEREVILSASAIRSMAGSASSTVSPSLPPGPGRCSRCRADIEARSPTPGEAPAINPHYLSEEPDRRAIVGGLRFARKLFAAPALQRFVREETLPGVQVQTDDELLDYARRNGGTCYHASCTCMMGSHALSVVDSELRVHGLASVRVIDASVMPAVTSTNTNAPTIMIAEKAAAMIKEGGRQRLAA
jgi:choline dehydrogenase-like flavoprotein